MVHLVPNVLNLAGDDGGIIRLAPKTTLHFNTVQKTRSLVWTFDFYLNLPYHTVWRQHHTQLGFEHWVLDGPP